MRTKTQKKITKENITDNAPTVKSMRDVSLTFPKLWHRTDTNEVSEEARLIETRLLAALWL